ncbi:unnamed protein product [Callosobruchus maculatus]|nr:unnamed protein product [Callosobruchus maculatus]
MKKHEAQKDTCLLCNLKVKNRLCLIDHTMAEHPYNIIDECAVKADLANCKLIVCNHCNHIFTRKINLADHIVKKHPEFIDSVSDQIHECNHCTYKTTNRHRLTRHLLKHPKTASADGHKTCIHCNKTFTNSPSLNDHIIRQHPEFVGSVPGQIYACSYCTFKTVTQSILLKHLSTHPEADDSDKLKKCIHCNAQFKRKISLDAHIIKDHPEFIASVSRKIHKCIHCSYKSAYKQNLQRHLDKHQETVECQISVCVHCDATFKNSRSLDDHMVRKHPSSIASITRKIHKCTICSYKSIIKEHVRRHMLKHSEAGSICEVDTTAGDATLKTDEDSLYNDTIKDHSVTSKIFKCAHCTYKTNIKYFLTRHLLTHPEEAHRCVHCNATFKSKTSLYDHTIKKHSEMIDSVPGKIHECTHCTYKSTSKNLLTRHMKTHPGSPGYEINKCMHCHLKFKGKASLDEHIVRRHPEFIDSVSRNIHECKRCTFKTTLQSYFTKNMLKHAKADSLCMCIHCTETFKTKKGLDNHMVSTHPKSMNTDSVEVYYQCTFCTYKTTYRGNLARHCGIKHPERADAHEVIACIYCKATFKSKRGQEDHIVRKHPNIAASVSKA